MSLRFGILTVSDRSARDERPDASGPALREAVSAQGWLVVRQEIVPDEFAALSDRLATWSDSGEIDIILATGGTGFSPRDITPEATQAVIERPAPGMAEAMRASTSPDGTRSGRLPLTATRLQWSCCPASTTSI